jgi:hypothetical protein
LPQWLEHSEHIGGVDCIDGLAPDRGRMIGQSVPPLMPMLCIPPASFQGIDKLIGTSPKRRSPSFLTQARFSGGDRVEAGLKIGPTLFSEVPGPGQGNRRKIAEPHIS